MITRSHLEIPDYFANNNLPVRLGFNSPSFEGNLGREKHVVSVGHPNDSNG